MKPITSRRRCGSACPANEAKEAPPTPYEPVRIAAAGQTFSLPDLAGYRIVALCNVAAVSREDAGRLSRFVEVGRKPDHLRGRPGRRGRLLDARERKPVAGPDRRAGRVGPVPARSSGSRIIRSSLPLPTRCMEICEPCDSARSPGSRPCRRPGCSPRAQGGLPILLERTKGRGRCLLFAIPADNAWGDWAIHRLFLPLVHQVAGYLTDRLPGTGRVQVALAGRGRGRVARRDDRKWPGPRPQRRRRGIGRRTNDAGQASRRCTAARHPPRMNLTRTERAADLGRRQRAARRALANGRLGLADRARDRNFCCQQNLRVIRKSVVRGRS